MIKVGDLTTNFFKREQVDYGGMPLPSSGDNPFEHTYALLADLSERLNNLENSIQFKVDNGNVISQILLTEDAALISADRIAVVGQVTFADFVRDQNGQSTGVIDDKITQIIADKIRTGSVWSNDYINSGGTTGMVMDLDNSRFHLGGESAPTLKFSANKLEIAGIVNILDRGSELGYLATGTAAYVTGVGPSGSGIIVGSPGIMGVYNGDIKLAFNSSDGSVSMTGALIAATGTFSGDLVAAGGTFSGNLSAVGGTFTGTLSGVDGTFSGNLSAVGGTFIGTLSGVDGTFSGNLSAVGGTFTGTLSGVDGTFSGTLSSTKQVYCNTTTDALSTNAAIKGVASFGYGVHGDGISGGVYGKCTSGGSGVTGYSNSAVGTAGTFQNTAGGKALWALGNAVCSANVDIGGNLDVVGDIEADEIVAVTKFHKGDGSYEPTGTMKVWQIATGTDANGTWGTYRYTFY